MKRRLPFPILHEDRDLIVIDKPAGLLTTCTRLAGRAAREAQRTAENLLNDYVRKGQAKSRSRVWLVHRLDRETSGVMAFAKSEEVAERFRANWSELTEKTYLARVEGEMAEESGAFEGWLREDPDGYRVRMVPPPGSGDRSPRPAKFARTEWRRLECGGGETLVEVSLKSGRKNQIRVQFAAAGHPVKGDAKYGARTGGPLCLRSVRLRLLHPRTGEWMEFRAPEE